MIEEVIFLDTSFLVAYYNKKDEHHKKARRWVEKVRFKKLVLVISDYVFDELLTVVLVRRGKDFSIQAGRKLRKDKRIFMIRVSENIFEEAWKIYEDFKDKKWSFTDCTSYKLIESLGIRKAASFDEHFKEFGIEIVG